jgi:His-Xaa-Ser system protein HxsD
MNKIAFSLNSKIVSLEAIYSTCYSFIDKFYIYLDKNKENIIVSLQPKEKETKINPKAIEGEFRNELLNNLLREKIAKNNAKIREYILGQALYSSMPSEVEEFLSKTSEDYLGIAVPWEEKIKSKNKATKKKSKSK